jgi:hypothetical protein
MPANTLQLFTGVPSIQWGTTLTTANTAKDGTGTVVLCFTAHATYGSRVDRIRFKAIGTNTASVARVFINNGSDPTTATNNAFYADVSLPATTLSEVAGIAPAELPNNATIVDATSFPIALPPGYRIYVTIGTTVAAGWVPVVTGGHFSIAA